VIRLAVRVRREHAELVLAELLELEPAGVEELPEQEGVVEYAVYGAPGELPSLPDVRAAAGGALVEISTSEVADDWSERWREFHKPVLIEPPDRRPGSRADAVAASVAAIGVRPPWVAPEVWQREDVLDIVIDPAQAFGTGAHATTRLCLELLLELAGCLPARARGELLDIGTGSGVLAIAAARLGFAPVIALDHDCASVDAARVNAAVNRVAIDVRRVDIRSQRHLQTEPGAKSSRANGVVLANLLAPLLTQLATSTLEATPAHLIAGGLLREQADEVARAFSQRLRMREHARSSSGEWSALWLTAE
jgi:ribosomal protein L11 methyltransferase